MSMSPAGATPSGAGEGPEGPLVILCRDAWRAEAPRKGLVEHRVSAVTIHHTAAHFDDNRRAPRALRSVQSWHLRHPKRPIPDIAYHYIIDRNGLVYEGRSASYRGDTHTDYDPTGHLLICLLGNFEAQAPSRAQLDTLADLVRWALTRYKLTEADVNTHRELAATACPGKALHREVKRGGLTQRLVERRARVPETVLNVCGQDALKIVEQVEGSRRYGRDDAFKSLKSLVTKPRR